MIWMQFRPYKKWGDIVTDHHSIIQNFTQGQISHGLAQGIPWLRNENSDENSVIKHTLATVSKLFVETLQEIFVAIGRNKQRVGKYSFLLPWMHSPLTVLS